MILPNTGRNDCCQKCITSFDYKVKGSRDDTRMSGYLWSCNMHPSISRNVVYQNRKEKEEPSHKGETIFGSKYFQH